MPASLYPWGPISSLLATFSGILSPCGGKGNLHEALCLCHLNDSQFQFPKLHGVGERNVPKERDEQWMK